MCNHYQANPNGIPDWAEWIGFDLPQPREDMNRDIWPKRSGPIARMENGKGIVDVMTWGIPMTIPGKRPGSSITKHVTNVRNLSSPFWKAMLKEPGRRCLVPFSKFAEPKPGKDPETGRPAEHWFMVNDAPVAAFAGIWRPSEAGNVYAFLTCEPNPLVAPLHPKAMPVILQPDDYDRWLTTDYEGACTLAAPFPSQLMSVS